MRKSYPSDITREQFEVIRPILEGATKRTHPRKYDLYDIFCAVLYLIKEGCTWRAIPHDFGRSRMRTDSVCWTGFYAIWWR